MFLEGVSLMNLYRSSTLTQVQVFLKIQKDTQVWVQVTAAFQISLIRRLKSQHHPSKGKPNDNTLQLDVYCALL